MTSLSETMTRRKIIGVLIRAAREQAGKSAKAAAAAIGRSPKALKRIEAGDEDISMPELIALAHFLDVPIDYFFDESITLTDLDDKRSQLKQAEDQKQLVMRHLREARERAKLTQAQLAARIDSSARIISLYERGKRHPSAAHLVQLAEVLDIPMRQLLPHEAERVDDDRDSLPQEVRQFALDTRNLPYLRAAVQLRALSPVDAQKLIAILSVVVEQALPSANGTDNVS